MAGGKENLKVPTSEQAREYGKKGGKASGEARRKKKELKELLELALSQPCKDSKDDNWTAITAALIQKAIAGDTKAYEVIRDTIGQKPKDVVETELKGDVSIQITIDD